MTPTPTQLDNLHTAAICEKANGRGTVHGPQYRILEARGWMTSRLEGRPSHKGGGTTVRAYTLTPEGWAMLAASGKMPV